MRRLWQVLGVFFVGQVIATFVVLAIRLLGIDAPLWIAGGLGGLIGALVVQVMARRRLREQTE